MATPPIFEEHVSLGRVGETGVYSDLSKLEEMVQGMRDLKSMDGVLAAHVAIVPGPHGKPVYIHHFRTVDVAARERVLLAAHEVNATTILRHCEIANALHGNVEDPRAQDHHSSLMKLSTSRLVDDFRETAYLDWEGQAHGSHAVTFPAVRIVLLEYKDGTSDELIAEHQKAISDMPTKFPLAKQTTVGKNIGDSYAASQLYPPEGAIHWDLGFFVGYASSKDRAELDSLPEAVAMRDRWNSIIRHIEVYDMSFDKDK